MSKKREYINIRTGKFIWRDAQEQQRYIAHIRKKIDSGYYHTPKVTEYVVDTLAPVIGQALSM